MITKVCYLMKLTLFREQHLTCTYNITAWNDNLNDNNQNYMANTEKKEQTICNPLERESDIPGRKQQEEPLAHKL